jgi:hypothetical protein
LEEKSKLVDTLMTLSIKDWKIQQSLELLKGFYAKAEK